VGADDEVHPIRVWIKAATTAGRKFPYMSAMPGSMIFKFFNLPLSLKFSGIGFLY
jgi:hypothetical protein